MVRGKTRPKRNKHDCEQTMKKTLLTLTIAAMCGLPFAAFAQGTYLSAPDGSPTNALVVNNDGNVGIGNSNPTELLDVGGNIRMGGNLICPPYIAGQKLNLFNATYGIGVQTGTLYFRTGGTFAWHYGGVHSDGYADPGEGGARLMLLNYAGNLWVSNLIESSLLTVGQDKLVVAAGGGVGIGTTTPHAKLDVAGDATFSGNMRIGGSGAIPSARLWIGDGTKSEVLFLDGQNAKMRLVADNSGQVYIQAGSDYISGSTADIVFGGLNGYPNNVVFKSNGNVGIGTLTPQAKLDVAGKVNCTVLELTSDRHQKTGFAPVDNQTILDQVARLSITTWRYTNEPTVQHIGPVAQDFKAAFNVGSDDKHIATVDADGVLFAAVQGLNQKLEAELKAKDTRIAALEKEVTTLRSDVLARMAAMEKHFADSTLAPGGSASSPPTPESTAQR